MCSHGCWGKICKSKTSVKSTVRLTCALSHLGCVDREWLWAGRDQAREKLRLVYI